MTQKYVVTRDQIEKEINALTEERDEFVTNANMRIVSINSKIEVLGKMLEPEELGEDDPALIETSIEADPEEEETASEPID